MRKSIFGRIALTIVLVAGLVLVIGDGNILFHKESEPLYDSVQNEKSGETQSGMVIIEESQVPMAASIEEATSETVPEETSDSVNTEQITSDEEKADVEVISCLIDGAHTLVWTDCGDYRVMKCSGCGQEIGNRAEQIADGVYGYYDDVSATLLFSRINSMRTGCKLSDELDDIASKRALECMKDPDNSNMQGADECIAMGQKDADSVIASWNASEYERDLLINPMYTEGGTACLWYDSGDGMQPVWILVLN